MRVVRHLPSPLTLTESDASSNHVYSFLVFSVEAEWSCYLSFSIYLFNEDGGEHKFTVSVMQSGKRGEQNQSDNVFAI